MIFSLKEFNSQDKTIALFLCQRLCKGDVAIGQSQVPLMKASLCLAKRAMNIDLFHLSKFSPLKTLDTKGCAGLSDG